MTNVSCAYDQWGGYCLHPAPHRRIDAGSEIIIRNNGLARLRKFFFVYRLRHSSGVRTAGLSSSTIVSSTLNLLTCSTLQPVFAVHRGCQMPLRGAQMQTYCVVALLFPAFKATCSTSFGSESWLTCAATRRAQWLLPPASPPVPAFFMFQRFFQRLRRGDHFFLLHHGVVAFQRYASFLAGAFSSAVAPDAPERDR